MSKTNVGHFILPPALLVFPHQLFGNHFSSLINQNQIYTDFFIFLGGGGVEEHETIIFVFINSASFAHLLYEASRVSKRYINFSSCDSSKI